MLFQLFCRGSRAFTVIINTVTVSTAMIYTVPVSTAMISTVPVSTAMISTVPVSTAMISTVAVSTAMVYKACPSPASNVGETLSNASFQSQTPTLVSSVIHPKADRKPPLAFKRLLGPQYAKEKQHQTCPTHNLQINQHWHRNVAGYRAKAWPRNSVLNTNSTDWQEN